MGRLVGPGLSGQGLVGAFLVGLPAAERARLGAALRLAGGAEDGPRSFVATARLCQGRLPAKGCAAIIIPRPLQAGPAPRYAAPQDDPISPPARRSRQHA